MKKFFIGRSPITTIAGFILAALLSLNQAGAEGAQNWQDYIVPAAIAVFGRMAGDNNKRPPLPPLPMPDSPELPEFPVQPATFRRRGREHRQRRNSNGRFVAATS